MRRRSGRVAVSIAPWLACVAALGLVATTVGCADTADSTPSPTAIAGGSTGTPQPTATAEQAKPSPSPTETAAEQAAPACLIGTWRLRNESFQAALSEIMLGAADMPADIRASASITLSGSSFIRFDGTDVYGAWQDDFTIHMAFDGHQATHTISSSDVATYEADDNYLWVTDFQQLHWEAEMNIDGMVSVSAESENPVASINFFDYSGHGPAFDREMVDGAAKYDCSAETLVLHADGGMTADFSRVP